MDEYAPIYWAAACLSFWADGLSDGQFADAVNTVCNEASLKPAQKSLLKRIVNKITQGVGDGVK